ncbi:hypothetical protein [Brevibacillus massiliensis]|uniref:hypothetical protein n=1 Tax=Brevibacillus massiliensis TaxID=1118054 RepID=UPI0012B51B79|nr:hypothetical protein [Brevibacillus massiliensis]
MNQMGGRGKYDKSERRNNHPPAKPSDLDQFGGDIRGKRMSASSRVTEGNERGG